ncbi:hypothetical protein WMY93_029106 [Mugilogobius chulae]|uniref:G-protein coupled receptors family 1 profile domain-containing protein n=1 Tax=Mugilogobius chulae TaxID=88201 RepID=A0AAW0N0J6_9GOBI
MINATFSNSTVDSNSSILNISVCPKNDEFKYPLYSTIFSIVFVVGLITNVVAIYIFMCTLKLRNETTTYMMNLVVSDLLFVFTLPLRIFYFISRDWPFGSMLCKVSVSLFYTNMYGSILFLTCISVDRFLAIVHPFRSRTLRTKRNAKIVCMAVWVLVLSGSLPSGFLLNKTIQNSIKRKNTVLRSDVKFSEALQSETSSNLHCSLRISKPKCSTMSPQYDRQPQEKTATDFG